jgi:hypothetical protein
MDQVPFFPHPHTEAFMAFVVLLAGDCESRELAKFIWEWNGKGLFENL